LQSLLDLGVVGDVVAHQFDANGCLPDIPANRRAISLDADSLRRIPRVIAVSGGKAKIAAIHAALLAHFCSCLVTDAVAARGVLQMHADRRSRRMAE
jgi:deoxyribonucleoside regulator